MTLGSLIVKVSTTSSATATASTTTTSSTSASSVSRSLTESLHVELSLFSAALIGTLVVDPFSSFLGSRRNVVKERCGSVIELFPRLFINRRDDRFLGKLFSVSSKIKLRRVVLVRSVSLTTTVSMTVTMMLVSLALFVARTSLSLSRSGRSRRSSRSSRCSGSSRSILSTWASILTGSSYRALRESILSRWIVVTLGTRNGLLNRIRRLLLGIRVLLS